MAGALAAELEQQALHAAAGDLGDAPGRRAVEPVKLTMSTCGEATGASAAARSRAGDDVDDARREAGLLEELAQPDDGRAGPAGAGFTTTVLPMASAGPILPAMLVSGKLYEVMAATTPTGAAGRRAPMIAAGRQRGGRHDGRRQRR